jgi:RES domain-containing protein
MSRAAGLAATWEGEFYRSCKVRYARGADLTSGEGSLRWGGRWNAPGLSRVVYGSSTPESAVAESLAGLRRAGIEPARAAPFVIAALRARFRSLDLTSPQVLDALALDAGELASDPWWEAQGRGAESLTQAVGRAAFEAGLGGLRAASRVVPGAVNLAVFVDRLGPGERLEARGLDDA